jgi:cytosine/adenosine deaminase-related metal-dependent hydrolase
LKNALKDKNISEFILSRPVNLQYNKEEVDILLDNSNGIGLSSISDWEYSELEKISKHVKKNNKIFAIHASERMREDVDLVLDLKPNFLIHMVKASESDLTCVKENNIPIVLCPRSNNYFGLKPNLNLMKKTGVEILLGTDNAMLNSPNVLDELKFLNDTTDIYNLEQLLNMITFTSRKVLNLSPCILGSNLPVDFIVLDKNTLKILYISCVK